jgi:hypothetical protein
VSCFAIVEGNQRVGSYCTSGPTKVLKVQTVPGRWCFACRTRSDIEWTLTGSVEPSYYGPNWQARCVNCGQVNGDVGFGRERNGGDW